MDRLAHDLRGPLTPLQTAAYLLRSGQVSPERQQELYALIERQTRQLVRMIDELGDWTRAAQDRLVSAGESCDPALLLDYARANSGAAGAQALVDNQADGTLVNGDPVRLTQLLRVLLEYSAWRGNGAPSIAIGVEGGRLRIDMRASGVALEPEQLARLLEQPEADAHDEGLGLQLLIARAIAEAHGGALLALADAGDLVLRCELPISAD
jgi:K+-sensing histidine kinase KdpD